MQGLVIQSAAILDVLDGKENVFGLCVHILKWDRETSNSNINWLEARKGYLGSQDENYDIESEVLFLAGLCPFHRNKSRDA